MSEVFANVDVKSETLLLLLYRDSEYSLLPELLDAFGGESLLRFLDIFGGTTVTVPSREKLERSIRDVDIFVTLKGRPEDKKPEIRRHLATKYEVSLSSVQKIEAEMAGLYEQYQGAIAGYVQRSESREF